MDSGDFKVLDCRASLASDASGNMWQANCTESVLSLNACLLGKQEDHVIKICRPWVRSPECAGNVGETLWQTARA